ncbi:hypothetical protein [Azospirillum largimobile]
MARMLFLRDIDADVQLRCRACGHGGVLPRAMLERRFGPNYPVLSIAPHYRCSRCDSRDIESRPILAAPPAASFEAANEEPSFDAPLAALNGLLASLRGGGPVVGAQTSSPPPPPPPLTAPMRGKPLSELPLSDLVADGPGDDGTAPLWEPVSLADMAARLGAIRPGDDEPDRDGELDGGEPVDAEWDDPAPPAAAGEEIARNTALNSDPDEGGDETLAAMHRLLAQAHWSEDDEPDDRKPAPARHFEQPGTEEDIDDGQEEESEPPVFSHKVLVRRDFDEDWADPDSDRWQDDDRDAADGFDEDEEPSDEEILSFAIRDPEKPAARPAVRPAVKSSKPAAPPPADEPLNFDQHRAERRAQRPPPPPEDEEGFDRTLAALRSMIEDAANDTDDDAPPPPRKSPAARERGIGKGPDGNPGRNADRNPGTAAGWEDEDASRDDPLSRFDADPAPDPEMDPDPDRDPAPAGRRSAQEREIEEAMKALRGLIEEEVTPEPPPAPAPPPKPRAGKPRPPSRIEPPAPPAEEAGPAAPAGKQAAPKAVDPTPLSKTIAALRGMLELDGKRKR